MSLTSPHDKMSAARLLVAKDTPYFTAALLALVPHELPGLGTIGVTESGILLWDPTTVAKWTVQELAAGLEHEIGHVLRKHASRAKIKGILDPDHCKLWNLAGDCEINDDLEDAGRKLPFKPAKGWGDEGYAVPESFGLKRGLTAEEYYVKIRDQWEKLPKQPGSGQGRGEGKEGEGAGGAGGGEGYAKPGPGSGWCGSGAGRRLPEEPKDQAAAGGRSESDMNRVRGEVAVAIKEHAERQKGRGNIPAGWLVWANEQLAPPKIPWKAKLAKLLRGACAYQAGKVDLTWNRPSRRQGGVGFGAGRPVLPAMHAPVPEVTVWVDTSGSMLGAPLKAAASEIQGVLKAVGAKLTIGVCDAEVHGVKEVRTMREAVAALKGGGGTDFGPIFREQARQKRQPAVVIVMTDGDGSCPQKPPISTPVIWCLIGKHAHRPCDWGTFIVVDAEEGL